MVGNREALHPTSDLLAAFALGHLDDSEAILVADHLGDCETCQQAIRAIPAVAELELVEATAGLRPGTPDDGPLIGEWEGFLVAAGHYRNGILLAPVTADAIAALLVGDAPPVEVAPFGPERFG